MQVYSLSEPAPTLLLDPDGREETDLIYVKDITGLNPVKAGIASTSYAAFDGVDITGANVPGRNIVITLGMNPDWNTWTYTSLRKRIYNYFMPKSQVNLVFSSDDIDPVQIIGTVESCEVNPFSKDPEIQVSIICPDPYFTAVDPTVQTGNSANTWAPVEFEYEGDVETGFQFDAVQAAGPSPTTLSVQVEDPLLTFFTVLASMSTTLSFHLKTVISQKYVQNVDSSGVITNLISKIQPASAWPTLKPGTNQVGFITDKGLQNWTLTYYARYGGL